MSRRCASGPARSTLWHATRPPRGRRPRRHVVLDPVRALRFYERHEFAFVERRRFGDDDCILYRLDWSPGEPPESPTYAFRPPRCQTRIHPHASMPADPILFPSLSVANLAEEGAASTGPYRNVVIGRVNESCLRLSAFEGDYRWHLHPESDELFVVVDGRLAIDLADGTTLHLGPWESVMIPAGTIHRTRALPRAVNLCVEHLDAETVFVESPF